MSNEGLEIATKFYQNGKTAFECGRYRQAVDELEKAVALLVKNTKFGGEVQIWLATAYEASGRNSDAIALCEQLKRHPHGEVNQQAKRLQYIWQAPKLQRPQKWMTKIPDFAGLDENDGTVKFSAHKAKSPISQSIQAPEPEDLTSVNDHENRFLILALIAIALMVLYWGMGSGLRFPEFFSQETVNILNWI